MEETHSCIICGEQNVAGSHFKNQHKLKISEYYERHEPKFDRLTGEQIKYVTYSKYLETEFTNKNNAKKWLKEQNQEIRDNYILSVLGKRSERKQLLYAPSEIELYTSNTLPSRKFLDTICDFDALCDSLNLLQRFKPHSEEIVCDKKYQDEKYWINIDPREQKPFKPKYPVQIKKLDFGDYSLSHPEETGDIFVERKSLIDLVCTLSGGYSRFEAEIIRAKQAKSYIIVLVEGPLAKLFALERLPQLRNTKIKASSEYITYQIRSLMERFNNLNFVFADGRKDAAQILFKLLFSNGICKDIDVQLAKQNKLI